MKKTTFAVLIIIIIAAAFLSIKALDGSKEVEDSPVLNSADTEASSRPSVQGTAPADSIEVVHFHGTHQCWSCITVGEYALYTIKEKFPDEYRSGIIVFKDINAELPENKEVVTKYQARGSSLFVNAIRNSQDNIEEDTKVWNLVTDKNKFTEHFESKLKALLGI